MVEGQKKACALYTRVSLDPMNTTGSTKRQEENCRRFCESREWSVVRVFEDIDESAYGGQERPAFEQLIGHLSSGQFDTLVVWRLDRLSRRPAEFERIWAECERNNVAIASVTEPIDTSSGVGIAVMRMLVTFAGLESTVKSERISARNRQDAEKGLPHAGKKPYGYDVEMNIIPHEAAFIQEAANRVLAGESMVVIAKDLADRGAVGRKGRPFTGPSLRKLLVLRTLVGERTYHGKFVATGTWEPILDPLTGAQVRQTFAGGNKGGRHRKATNPLLAGLLRCGRCHHPLCGGEAAGNYRCPDDGCGGGLGITTKQTDYWVRETVLWRLEQRWPINRRTPTLSDDQSAELIMTLDWAADATKRINSARWIDGTISHHEYVRLRTEIETRTGHQLHSTSEYFPPRQLPTDFKPGEARRFWPKLSTVARRAVIELEINHIVVHPSERYGWYSDRLEPDYWQPLSKRSEKNQPDFAPPPPTLPHGSPEADLQPYELHNLYMTQRYSITEIAKRTSLSVGVITYRLKEMGVAIRPGDRRREKRTNPDLASVVSLYQTDGLPIPAVAVVLGVGAGRVRRTLEDNGIPIRGESRFEKDIVALHDMYNDKLVKSILELHQVAQRPWTGTIYERFPEQTPMNETLLIQLFEIGGCSALQIEMLTGIPESTIRRWLRAWGVNTKRHGPSPCTRRMKKLEQS